nr:alpha/beta fold hydrolase [uncultured Carboxylicivirga sp.]
MKKSKIRLLLFLVIAFIIAVGLFDYFGTRLIVDINGGIYSFKNRKNSFGTPEDFGLNSEKLSLETEDDIQLKCLLVNANTSEEKGTIILLHGIRGRKEHFYQLSKQLADSGYNSVLVDLRAHGESSGSYCTYGFKEKYDIKRVVEYLKSRKDVNNNIGIWGQSLGAAIALQSMGICQEIKFGIIESTFSDFKDIVHDYFKFYLGFDIPILSEYLIYRSKNVADFNPEEVKPCVSCTNITQPIIIAHGDIDDRIKIEYGRLNFKNVASLDKQFIEVKNANHVNLWQVGGDKYKSQIFKFLERHAKK